MLINQRMSQEAAAANAPILLLFILRILAHDLASERLQLRSFLCITLYPIEPDYPFPSSRPFFSRPIERLLMLATFSGLGDTGMQFARQKKIRGNTPRFR